MKTSALFFALAFGLSAFSHAQIFVGSGGLPAPLTFDSAPQLLAVEWASTTTGIAGDGGTFTTAGDVSNAVQNISQSSVGTALERITSDSTFQAARHNTAAGYLITQPTSLGIGLLKATLRNTASQAFSHITVSYSFGFIGGTGLESAAGHQVFFSTNGLPGSWRLIPAFSSLITNTAVNATLFVGRWMPNTDIYLLWADDNAPTSSEPGNTIDNFLVSSPVVTNISVPLSITLTAPMSEAIAFNPVTVSAAAAGSQPVTGVVFYANDVFVATDTTAPYSVAVNVFSPTNRFYARALNTTGSVTSVTNTVRVREEFAEYTGGTYQQNFDSMGPSGTETPPGWYAGITLPATTVDVTAGDGSSIPLATVIGWNHGTTGSGDRALGTSPTAGERNMVLRLRNNSGSPINSFTLLYDGEVWRNYTNATSGWLTNYVSYDLGATWIPTGFHFQQPFASVPVPPQSAVDGNLPGNRTTNIGGLLNPLSPIPVGGVIYFRWHDFNESGTDGALAVDNVHFTVTPGPVNDTCDGAITLTNGVPYTQNTTSASAAGEPTFYCFRVTNGVWFTYTPTANGRLSISTCNSDFRTDLVVYRGACNPLVGEQCGFGSEEGCINSLRGFVEFAVTNGVTYRILVGGTTGSGNLSIVATLCVPPSSVVVSVDTTANAPNGVEVTYRADYNGSLATSFQWRFDGNFQATTTQPFYSHVFGAFDTFPDVVSVLVFNDCETTGVLGGNQVNPPCGAICLSAGAPVTRTGTSGGSDGFGFEYDTPCGYFGVSNTKWFRLGILTNANGIATISAAGSLAGTFLGVYSGFPSSPWNLTRITCTNDPNGVMRFETRPTEIYWLAVSSPNFNTLQLTHGYELIPPLPANDLCANAIAMSPGVTYSNNTLNATGTETPPAAACVASFGRGVWYSYLATSTGPVLLSTCGSDFDTALQVYTGTSCGALVALVGSCTNNNGPLCPGNAASLRFNATNGITYRILVGGANQAAGNLIISATPCTAPAFAGLNSPVTLEANGVRVFYEANFSGNTPYGYRWSFSDGAVTNSLSNQISRLFGPFQPYPASVTISATNFCGTSSFVAPLVPPCEPLCLASALDTNRTHFGTNGSGTNGVSYTNNAIVFPAVGTRWFRLSPLTNSAGGDKLLAGRSHNQRGRAATDLRLPSPLRQPGSHECERRKSRAGFALNAPALAAIPAARRHQPHRASLQLE